MEGTVLLALQAIRIDLLSQFLAFFSALGNWGFVWFLLAIIFLVIPSTRRGGLALLLSTILTLVVCFVVAKFVGRAAPGDVVAGLASVQGVSRGFGIMPCAHVAFAFAATTAFYITINKRAGSIALIFALITLFARMYLGVNYPTDVIAGAAIGIFIALIISKIVSYFLDGRGQKEPKRKSVRSR